MKNKRGFSAVITAMILIALTISLVAIVWAVINNLVTDELGSVEGCTETFGKVEINRFFTCYDSSNDVLQFSVSIGDIELDGLLISVSSEGSGESFVLTPTGVERLNDPNSLIGFNGDGPVMPKKNSGLTYNYTLTSNPELLTISPQIEDNQCGETDVVLDFPSCESLV